MKRNCHTLVMILTVCFALLVPLPAGASSRNPLATLPVKVRHEFACIMWHESRSTISHPNLGDNRSDGGSSGVFQIVPLTWNRWAPLVGVRVPVWRASYVQQQLVAIEIWRKDTFAPWRFDGCV